MYHRAKHCSVVSRRSGLPVDDYFRKVAKFIIKEVIMCLYPRLILNKKYLPNRKNNFRPPKLHDMRLKYVAVGCGVCEECMRQKKREWQVRLNEEVRIDKSAKFITLTFSEESLQTLKSKYNITSDNAIAKIATRLFLERWRKRYKKSVKHWLITELGEENDRIHMHGLLWANIDNETLHNIWQYGLTYIGEYVNEKTINYIIKYCTKIDQVHKLYRPIILCSAGLGKDYIRRNAIYHKIDNSTKEYYTLPNGNKVALPIYYRNRLWTENEREKLWQKKLDAKTIYVNGIECDISTEQGLEYYQRVLEEQQKQSKAKGYGDNTEEWRKKDYNITLRMLNAKSKLQKPRKTKKS